ncbi:MAG: hypothetical protein SCH70_13260 [Candidatus Methanoperedens sp.]|nr:hypothetical protein [Candidatus Methanoperedens sp.]
MQHAKWDKRKWGNICLIFSFFGILIGVIGLLAFHSIYSISVIWISLGAFFASIVMRGESAKRHMLKFRFASGICLAAAIFSQAIFIKNQTFAMIMYVVGFVFLISLTVDIYKKYLKNQDN